MIPFAIFEDRSKNKSRYAFSFLLLIILDEFLRMQVQLNLLFQIEQMHLYGSRSILIFNLSENITRVEPVHLLVILKF